MNATTNPVKGLTNEKMLQFAPSIAAEKPHPKMSGKYAFVPTLEVVNIMREQGWYPAYARQAKAYKNANKGFQKHLVRMRHPELIKGGEFVEATIINSHNGQSCYIICFGIFRLVCTNGLITGETFGSIRIRHIGFKQQDVIDASCKLLGTAPKVVEHIDAYKAIELDPPQKKAYAQAALAWLYEKPEKSSPVTPAQLLEPKRDEDRRNDLWTTYNVVQENLIKGGLEGVSPKTGKKVKTRPIKALDKDVRLNRALWTLADKMAGLVGKGGNRVL